MAELHISDLLDLDDLDAAIEGGFVRVQTHPTKPLRVFNYTAKTQYDRAWTSVTTQCRGLIADEDGKIVARPFAKFFNYAELTEPLPLDVPVFVAEKMDGSLGVLHPIGDGEYAVATRGSFASEQAIHATKVWQERYAARVRIVSGYTYLFEIIYPANRIVCDYKDLDDLVFLGAVSIDTGRMFLPDLFDWPGLVATSYGFATLGEALAAPDRVGAEGLVVHFPSLDGLMVKIKQSEYVELHRILTNSSARTIWEFLAVNACRHLIAKPKHWGSRIGLDPERAAHILGIGPDWLAQFIDGVPDEFHAWIRTTITTIQASVDDLLDEMATAVRELRATYGDDRKAVAAAIADHPHMGALFYLYDDKSLTTYAWRAAYPEAEKPWGARSEDVS